MKHLRRVAQRLGDRLRTARTSLRRWWSDHRTRLAGEFGYADAFAAVLIATADLLLGSYRTRFAVRELVRAYVALQRIFSPPISGWSQFTASA